MIEHAGLQLVREGNRSRIGLDTTRPRHLRYWRPAMRPVARSALAAHVRDPALFLRLVAVKGIPCAYERHFETVRVCVAPPVRSYTKCLRTSWGVTRSGGGFLVFSGALESTVGNCDLELLLLGQLCRQAPAKSMWGKTWGGETRRTAHGLCPRTGIPIIITKVHDLTFLYNESVLAYI
jgi:hypothetical protein